MSSTQRSSNLKITDLSLSLRVIILLSIKPHRHPRTGTVKNKVSKTH